MRTERRNYPEHQHQVALIRWANMSVMAYPELRWLFAVPNAAKRSVQLAAMLKAEGLKAGVPDLILPCARGGFNSLAIEMKSAAGRTSGAQDEWIEGLTSLGWRVEVCR